MILFHLLCVSGALLVDGDTAGAVTFALSLATSLRPATASRPM